MTQQAIQKNVSLGSSYQNLPSINVIDSLDDIFDNILYNMFQIAKIYTLAANKKYSRDDLMSIISNQILNCKDQDNLIDGILTCSSKHIILSKTKAFIELPSEIVIGLMLKRLKDISNKNFTQIAESKFPHITFRTCENYMLTAKIINYKHLYKYLTAGSMTIRGILSLITDAEFMKKYKGIDDFIAYAFQVISEDKNTNDSDYARMASYVALFHTKFKQFNTDKTLYYELYKTGFNIANSDVNFVCTNAYANKKLVKPTILNSYMRNLLIYELNREKAKNAVIQNYNTNPVVINVNEIKYTKFDNGIEDIQSTLDYLESTNPSFKISSERKESVQKLINRLTELYKKSFPNG